MTNIAPFGAWKSPITTDLIVCDTVGLIELALDGDDVYWIEMRPNDAARYVIVRREANGATTDLLPAPFSARTRVHEYGGGAFAVRDGVVLFSNFSDQRLYRVASHTVAAITPPGALRFADGAVHDGRLVCVIEDHQGEGEPRNAIAVVDLQSGAVEILAEGADFYSTPRVSPDGKQLTWQEWDHPNMPWDGSRLMVADWRDHGTLANPRCIAGGDRESVFQPEWSPGGVLHFVSDRTGWWNLYCWRAGIVEPLCPLAADFGRPQWVFGTRTYAFAATTQIVCAHGATMALLDTESGKLATLDLPYTSYSCLHAAKGQAVFIAASPTTPPSVVQLDLASGAATVLCRSSDTKLDPGDVSVGQAIEFPTLNGLMAHAFHYPPTNADFAAPEGDLPPLIVKSHGGPTSSVGNALNLDIQFWTSRGFAVVDVNYGGSTGYGRAYRERLDGQWGVVDVDDCASAAQWLVAQGLADPARLIIRGGSAGGYTTLAALTFREVFSAGASHFGISDLEAMARDTHKFESRYLDRLVGSLPARRDLYEARSPIHHVDRIACPMILLQGLEDKVVPPNQAEMMVDALRRKGLPVAYVPFDGEQHGFRQAKNIKRALEAELFFFGRVFGFAPADALEPVEIENLH